MIPGTRARNAKKNSKSVVETSSPTNRGEEILDRRALFQSLIPAFGNSVTKLVRTSNNLRRDLAEELENRSRLKQSKAQEEK